VRQRILGVRIKSKSASFNDAPTSTRLQLGRRKKEGSFPNERRTRESSLPFFPLPPDRTGGAGPCTQGPAPTPSDRSGRIDVRYGAEDHASAPASASSAFGARGTHSNDRRVARRRSLTPRRDLNTSPTPGGGGGGGGGEGEEGRPREGGTGQGPHRGSLGGGGGAAGKGRESGRSIEKGVIWVPKKKKGLESAGSTGTDRPGYEGVSLHGGVVWGAVPA